MATAWTRAPHVLAAIRAEGRYPDSTSRRSKARARRTVANTTNPVISVIELSPAVISVRLWPSTVTVAPVARSRNATPVCEIIEPISRYQTGTKATSRIQANRFRTCPARLSRTAVSSCWRMADHLLFDPPVPQVADPVKPLLLEDQVTDNHCRGSPAPQFPGHFPESEVGLPVETLIGLVQQQHRRVVHERQGQAELLPGATGQGAGPLVPAAGVAQPLDQGLGPAGAADPVRGLEVAHVLVDGERLIQDGRLRAVARPAPDGDAARVRAQVTGKDAQQRRLTGPVLTGHRDHLPGRDLQVKAGQHPPPAERFADPPCRQRSHSLRPLSANLVTTSLVRTVPGRPGCCLVNRWCAYHEGTRLLPRRELRRQAPTALSARRAASLPGPQYSGRLQPGCARPRPHW